MTQLLYRLRSGSTNAAWRTDDGVAFESKGQMEIAQGDLLAGVLSGAIVATPLPAGTDSEISVELTLSKIDALVPGAGAIILWLATRLLGSRGMTTGSYLALVIGPILVHSLMRLQMKRAWRRWLEEGIDETNEKARQRDNARRAGR